MNFLSLFIQSSNKYQEQATTDAIPDSTLSLNNKVRQILNKHHPISVITAVVHSQIARKFTRSIFLQIHEQNQQHFQEFQSIGMYGKVQIGYNSQGQSFNWIYFQVLPQLSGKLLNMLSFVSCTLLYEPNNLEFDRIFVQQTVENFNKCFNKTPSLYIIHGQLNKLQINTSQHVSFNQLVIPNQWPSVSTSIIQKNIQIAQNTIGKSFPLSDQKGNLISSFILPIYFTKWQKQSNFGEINSKKIWNQSIQQLEKYIKIKCIQEYGLKMSRLYQEKKFVSMKLLRNTHEISMQLAIKSAEKYKIPQKNLIEQLQELINQQLNKIIQQVMEVNLKWGKSWIQSQFLQIQARLKSKDLKLLTSLKQQFGLFVDYFHKKAQSLSCKKLEVYFQQFIINKAFDFSNYIHELDKKNLQQQVTEIKSKLYQSQASYKQLKKQNAKQQSINIKAIDELKQQLKTSKNRQQLLQSTIAHLKQIQSQNQLENQTKNMQIEQQFLSQVRNYKERISTLAQQLTSAKRQILSLQCQVEKQRQMHKHSKQYYNGVVSQMKNKQQQLKNQIDRITIKSNQQMEIIKRDSQRSLSESSISKNQRQRQGTKVLEQLNFMTEKFKQLEKSYNNLEYQMQLKKAESQVNKNDLQITLKISEQKVLQFQSRLPRYNKLQQQLIQSQKALSQLTAHQQQYQTETALLKQQNNFINQQLKQLENKYEIEKNNNKSLKTNLQQLEQKLGKLDKVKVNQWVQTQQDDKIKKMLQEALKVVQVLEIQYKKVKVQNSKLKTRLFEY